MSYTSELRPIVRATGRAGGGLLAQIPPRAARNHQGHAQGSTWHSFPLLAPHSETLGSYITPDPQFPHLPNGLLCEPDKIHLPKVLS